MVTVSGKSKHYMEAKSQVILLATVVIFMSLVSKAEALNINQIYDLAVVNEVK